MDTEVQTLGRKSVRLAFYVARVAAWLALWFVGCSVTAWGDARNFQWALGYYIGHSAMVAIPAALVLGLLKNSFVYVFGVALVMAFFVMDGRWK